MQRRIVPLLESQTLSTKCAARQSCTQKLQQIRGGQRTLCSPIKGGNFNGTTPEMEETPDD
jgi:hypothetical protein